MEIIYYGVRQNFDGSTFDKFWQDLAFILLHTIAVISSLTDICVLFLALTENDGG